MDETPCREERGLPFEAYDAEDADKAIRMASQALDFIRQRLA